MSYDELMTCISVALKHYERMKDKTTVDEVKKILTAISELVFDTFAWEK